MLSTLLEKTDPARRRIGTAIVVGIIGGFLSAVVKVRLGGPLPAPHPGAQCHQPTPEAPRAAGDEPRAVPHRRHLQRQ